MSVESDKIYPDCQTLIRTVEVGSHTKSQLLQKLQQHSILMNKLGERLLADDKFTISDTIYSVRAVELKVRNLGFPEELLYPSFLKMRSRLA